MRRRIVVGLAVLLIPLAPLVGAQPAQAGHGDCDPNKPGYSWCKAAEDLSHAYFCVYGQGPFADHICFSVWED